MLEGDAVAAKLILDDRANYEQSDVRVKVLVGLVMLVTAAVVRISCAHRRRRSVNMSNDGLSWQPRSARKSESTVPDPEVVLSYAAARYLVSRAATRAKMVREQNSSTRPWLPSRDGMEHSLTNTICEDAPYKVGRSQKPKADYVTTGPKPPGYSPRSQSGADFGGPCAREVTFRGS